MDDILFIKIKSSNENSIARHQLLVSKDTSHKSYFCELEASLPPV
jgi:hypothetical protein